MTKEFFEEVMRIPSATYHEGMMLDFIKDWGKKHGCKVKQDSKGNVYLEKGSGIRPTFIDHTDTVHSDQIEMVKEKVYKEIVWDGDHVTAKNPLTGKQTGLGMDNQGGCAIALAVIDRLKDVKALFTVEEEVGMRGVQAADLSFFDDAAFLFSNDSPDRNRATHYSSGVQLYSDDFFKKYLEPICKAHGVTDFRSEPYTCIKEVRRKWTNKDGKHLECLNVGNAGDRPHSDQEGASFKGVCEAEDLMYALCTEIPTDRQHLSDIKEEPRAWSYSSYAPSYSGSWRSPYSPWGSSLRQGAFSFGSSQSPRSDEKGSFVYAFSEKKARDEFVEKYMELPNVAKYLKREDVGVQSVRVSGERLYCRFAWLAAYNYDTGSSWKTWSEFEAGEPAAAREFERAFRPDEAEEEPAPEGLEGEAAYEFSSKIAAQRFLDDYVRQAKDVTGWPEKGNLVGMRGTRLALAKAWINAVASDKDEPGIAKSAEKDEGGWTEFSGKYPASAAAFEAAFKPSEKAAAPEPEDIGDGADVAVFVQADDPDDQAVIQDQILDRNIAVDIDFDPEGLFLTGLMKDVAEAWTVAKNVLEGTSYRSFRALSAADRLSAAEFFDAVDDASGQGEPIDAEFSEDDPEEEEGESRYFNAFDLIKPKKKKD